MQQHFRHKTTYFVRFLEKELGFKTVSIGYMTEDSINNILTQLNLTDILELNDVDLDGDYVNYTLTSKENISFDDFKTAVQKFQKCIVPEKD